METIAALEGGEKSMQLDAVGTDTDADADADVNADADAMKYNGDKSWDGEGSDATLIKV